MNKKYLFITLATLLIGSLLLSACSQTPVVKASPTSEEQLSMSNQLYTPVRTLSVNGIGKIVLVPDMAYINIGVRNEDVDVTSALSVNNDMAARIAEALKAKGVEEKDVQTTNFNVYPSQKYDNMGNVTSTTFVVENTINIKVNKLADLGALLDEAIRAGANNIYGIQFDIKDRQTVLDQARDLAIKDAQARAQSVATVAGVELGQIQSINVSTSSGIQPITYGMGGGGYAKDMSSTVPVSAGQLEVTYEANLIYEIK
ncbi:MAG: SIMPL domain-containing protein [Anaerolineaceae bacterium]